MVSDLRSVTVGPEMTDEANRNRKVHPHVGHPWVDAAVEVQVNKALRAARFLWKSAMRLVSDARAPVVIVHRQAERSWASDSQELRLQDTLRQSLTRFVPPPNERLP